MNIFRMNWVLSPVSGCLPNIGCFGLRGSLSFDLLSLNLGQFQKVLGVTALPARKGNDLY